MREAGVRPTPWSMGPWPAPRCQPAAEAMATNAGHILKNTKIYPDNAAAFADITRAYATTARPREIEKRVLSPQEAVSEMAGSLDDRMIKMALVFGPERTGLEN